MAINLTTNPTFTGRFTPATPQYPFGSSKNESSSGANDGTPYNLQRANDLFGFQQAMLGVASITPSGNPDTADESQYLEALLAIARARTEVRPLGNDNVYFRTKMLASPEGLAFPPTSGTAGDYTLGQQFVLGMWAGTAGVGDVIITDNGGIAWGADSVEMRYDLENTALFTQGDETVHIVDNAGASHWLKVADSASLSSTVVGSLLTVVVSVAIFAELGISSMRQVGLQDTVGVFGEKNALEVTADAQSGLLLGRAWADVKLSRAFNVLYTNTRAYSIEVAVSRVNANSATFECFVSGVTVAWKNAIIADDSGASAGFTVPPGATYQCDSTAAIRSWAELS